MILLYVLSQSVLGLATVHVDLRALCLLGSFRCNAQTEQRRQYKLLKEGKPSRMTIKRKALLDELGFVWQVRQRTGWNDRYDELIKFKEQYGDTIVPQQYEANRPLGKWVSCIDFFYSMCDIRIFGKPMPSLL